MRIGILGIQHESNTFLRGETTLDDFKRESLLAGDAIRAAHAASHHEVGGFFAGLEQAGVEAVPMFFAWAVPGGTITAEAARALVTTAMQSLENAGSLDGLLLAPHGAAVSEVERDFDGHWLSLVREKVGPNVPIVCTIDPHANVSPRMIQACNATVAYRTNPHLDQRQTGLAAAKLLVRTLRGEVRPIQRLAMPPVAISIDRQATAEQPCVGLYELADRIRARPGVLSNSVVLGFPYADVAEMGSSFIVVADGDPDAAKRSAGELVDYLIEHREAFACGLPDVEEAIDEAAASSERVCLLDVGDNVGGGSAGDGTILAWAIHERMISGAFVSLYDPAAADACRCAGAGAELELALGGRIDPLQGPPLVANVKVLSLHDGRFEETQPRHGGRTGYDMGLAAVVRTEHGQTIQLISKRTPPFSLGQITCCGLDPTAFHILVAKGVNAPIAAYQEVCPRMIRVNTPGVTTAEMTTLGHEHRRRPLFPFERS